jgi:hypothetical protein
VDLPETQYYITGKLYFGNFQNRSLDVQGIANLDSKYESDLYLIEGHYDNLEQLIQRINKYSILYNQPFPGTVERRINRQLQEKGHPLELDSLANNMRQRKITPREVKEYLNCQRIPFLSHYLKVRADGVYDDRTEENLISTAKEFKVAVVREFKVADITLKLILP